MPATEMQEVIFLFYSLQFDEIFDLKRLVSCRQFLCKFHVLKSTSGEAEMVKDKLLLKK